MKIMIVIGISFSSSIASVDHCGPEPLQLLGSSHVKQDTVSALKELPGGDRQVAVVHQQYREPDGTRFTF